jgi:hypothetical protein
MSLNEPLSWAEDVAVIRRKEVTIKANCKLNSRNVLGLANCSWRNVAWKLIIYRLEKEISSNVSPRAFEQG